MDHGKLKLNEEKKVIIVVGSKDYMMKVLTTDLKINLWKTTIDFFDSVGNLEIILDSTFSMNKKNQPMM